MYETIRELSNNMPVARMCNTLGVSRSGYYRWVSRDKYSDNDLELREQVQDIALEYSSYGYRRITAELGRRGFRVNRKRVLRVMREDNLLCLRKKSFVKTTDSNHDHYIYPNIAKDLEVCGINQLWVADITYIRLLREFIYLAIILDAFSRKCVGWELGRSLGSDLTVGALRKALSDRSIGSGLVHHSDQGVQYASNEYTSLLKENKIRISMSRKGNPFDNAKAESFIKTLKYEEVYLYEYEDTNEAADRIGEFLTEVYNQKRLHSALGYMPPTEFERVVENKIMN